MFDDPFALNSLFGISEQGSSEDSVVDPALEQMYQEFILEASRDPHGKTHFAPDVAQENSDRRENPGNQENQGTQETQGTRENQRSDNLVSASSSQEQRHEYCQADSHQFNPTCGDEVTVRVAIKQEEGKPAVIEQLVWDGHGCSISQASLSVLHDMAQGKSVDEFMKLHRAFRELMDSRGKGVDDAATADALGDAMAFQGVSRFPMRIKCALLGWEGTRDAVAKALATISPDYQ